MFRKVIKVESEKDLRIELPKEYLHKEIEITASEVDDSFEQKRKNIKEAIDFFNKTSVDMSNFKFDRDEANER